jgi:L-fuconolactonase
MMMSKHDFGKPNLIKGDVAKVDSHQHFWQLIRGDYQWLTPELTLLYRDYLPKDLSQELINTNVGETIVVQASDTEAETQFLLEVADKTDFVAGVVGWVDMESPTALSSLQAFSQNPYFKGIRPMLQDIDDENWVLQDKFNPIFEFLVANNLSFDALIKDQHLTNIQLIAKRYPLLKIVINHCAKPNINKPPSVYWKIQLSAFKTLENVSIKFSGLLTEASQGEVTLKQLSPYFEHIILVFGVKRIMWGSDWPVLKLNGDYTLWLNLTDKLLQKHSLIDQENILARNARNFYSLSPLK